MLYNAILSLALAATTEGLKHKHRDHLSNELRSIGDVSEGLNKRALRDRRPVAGPVYDREYCEPPSNLPHAFRVLSLQWMPFVRVLYLTLANED